MLLLAKGHTIIHVHTHSLSLKQQILVGICLHPPPTTPHPQSPNPWDCRFLSFWALWVPAAPKMVSCVFSVFSQELQVTNTGEGSGVSRADFANPTERTSSSLEEKPEIQDWSHQRASPCPSEPRTARPASSVWCWKTPGSGCYPGVPSRVYEF